MKKVFSAFLILVILLNVLVCFSSCSQETALEKLIYLKENALSTSEYNAKLEQFTYGKDEIEWKEKHNEEIKNKAIELGLSLNDGENATTPLCKEDIAEFVNLYSTKELFVLLGKLTRYITKLNESVVVWAVESHPNEFTHVMSLQENAEGYYSVHTNAEPIAREEPVHGNPDLSDRYTVKHYGDFAIEEGEYYEYYEGRYEWEHGVFYDEKGYHYINHSQVLYYKGNSLGVLSRTSSKYPQRNTNILTTDLYVFIAEEENLSYFVYKDETGAWVYDLATFK